MQCDFAYPVELINRENEASVKPIIIIIMIIYRIIIIMMMMMINDDGVNNIKVRIGIGAKTRYR